jgi:hypothetical protein
LYVEMVVGGPLGLGEVLHLYGRRGHFRPQVLDDDATPRKNTPEYRAANTPERAREFFAEW